MLHHLIVAIMGTAGLMIAWIAVQALKRRTDPDVGEHDDVLACGSCAEMSCAGCRSFRGAPRTPGAEE